MFMNSKLKTNKLLILTTVLIILILLFFLMVDNLSIKAYADNIDIAAYEKNIVMQILMIILIQVV